MRSVKTTLALVVSMAAAMLVSSMAAPQRQAAPATGNDPAVAMATHETDGYARVNDNPRFVQTYVNNIENMVPIDSQCPGDWRDLLYYMRLQKYTPDLFLVQQISDQSQLDYLASQMTNMLAGTYRGAIALSSPERMNSPCGPDKDYQTNAIIYRTGRFDLVRKSTWQSDAHQVGSNGVRRCFNNTQDRTVNVRARFYDKISRMYLTVGSVHWPTGGMNGPKCANENANEANARINAAGYGGALRIYGGDLNLDELRSDSTYKTWYTRTNGDLGGELSYRDAIYDDCSERYSGDALKDCLRANWTFNGGSKPRIDFLFAQEDRCCSSTPATPFVGTEATVTFNAADAADKHLTGTDSEVNYSQHRSVLARIHYPKLVATVTGSEATFWQRGEHFYLSDTDCDAHGVYLEYKLNGETTRLENYNGCGTTRHWNESFVEGQAIGLRACVDVQFGWDRCSLWRRTKT